MSEDYARKCRFHPQADAPYRCYKFEYDYCEECLDSCRACSDPGQYCRHRTACVIWELCRKKVKQREDAAAKEDVSAGRG